MQRRMEKEGGIRGRDRVREAKRGNACERETSAEDGLGQVVRLSWGEWVIHLVGKVWGLGNDVQYILGSEVTNEEKNEMDY